MVRKNTHKKKMMLFLARELCEYISSFSHIGSSYCFLPLQSQNRTKKSQAASNGDIAGAIGFSSKRPKRKRSWLPGSEAKLCFLWSSR